MGTFQTPAQSKAQEAIDSLDSIRIQQYLHFNQSLPLDLIVSELLNAQFTKEQISTGVKIFIDNKE